MEDKRREAEAEQLLQRREAGVLPEIDILGTRFIIDWRLRELRERNAPWNIINLRDPEWDEEAEGYLILYDREMKVGYAYGEPVIANPEDVVQLIIPSEFFLDPVSVAREHDLDLYAFLKEYPIEPQLKAVLRSDKLKWLAVPENNEQAEQSTPIENNLNQESKKGRGR